MTKLLLSLTLLTVFSFKAHARRIQFMYMARNFTLSVPDKAPKGPRPLVVLLHGCKQSPSIILEGTKLEKEAEKYGFLILSPEQPAYYNSDHCWNWFLDMNQTRLMTNEMGQIMAAVDFVGAEHNIDKNKIFVTGISAGGVMAHNLTACYPDVFAASAIHSGLTFKVAESIPEAQTVLTSYEQKSPSYLGKKIYECSKGVNQKLKKVMIIHGEEDSRVPALHANLISKSQAVWRDYMDDGKRNNSVTVTTKNSSLIFPNGYEVEVTELQYPNFLEKKLMIKGLGHAWGGGKPITVNFDPEAPSSNQFILEFFGINK
jgi:poly(hydroxyalkanoate) depolymerase family esterase